MKTFGCDDFRVEFFPETPEPAPVPQPVQPALRGKVTLGSEPITLANKESAYSKAFGGNLPRFPGEVH